MRVNGSNAHTAHVPLPCFDVRKLNNAVMRLVVACMLTRAAIRLGEPAVAPISVSPLLNEQFIVMRTAVRQAEQRAFRTDGGKRAHH